MVNNTQEPLVVWATEEPEGPIDPIPAIPMEAVNSDEKKFFVEVGASTMLSKGDIKGEYASAQTLWVFLYKVQRDTAFYRTVERLTYDELQQIDFRLEVSGSSEHNNSTLINKSDP